MTDMPDEIFINNKDRAAVDGGNLDMRYWTKYIRADLPSDQSVREAIKYLIPVAEHIRSLDSASKDAMHIKTLIAAAQSAKVEWQPISTAPRDGTRIVLSKWVGHFDHPTACWWIIDGFWKAEVSDWYRNTDGRLNEPTHWRPINKPEPQEGGEK